MAKDPAFLFYSADFLVGTMLMKDEQVGRYAKLMCLQHQTGHLTEEDMLKICQSHDKDIFDKFKQDENGLYYNERLEEEINKRAAFSKSRSDNRLGVNKDKKAPASSRHVSKHVSNTSKSHVGHMENENTTTIIDTNSNTGLNSNNNILNSSSNEVNNKSSTHVNHMSESGYAGENYRISSEMGDLMHPIEVCLWNYLNNDDFKEARGLHCIRLHLDPDPEKCAELLPAWGRAFNRALTSDNKITISMTGGNSSWLRYFVNWARKIKGTNANVNPDILFTGADVKTDKLGKGKIITGDVSEEDQQEHFKRKTRD